MNASASSSLVIGSVLLDKYRVERILGQGGMGYVVAVRHLQLGQLHAMKFLLPDALGHAEAVERFLREAQAAAILRSHHVVRVHDVGRMPSGAPYMVMEYLEGCDLKKYLELHGPLPVDEVVRFVLHACDAIAEAHRRGIIHRDLKPANLFLARQRDGDPIVKVVDFGISKHTDSDKPELTDTNATLGSPLYMSPEQISKSKSVDVGTDIWALGLIAYELLTGISPFRASSVLEVAAKVLQALPRPLRAVRPDVPAELADVIMRCLRKKRKNRWDSVDEFATALEPFLSQTQPVAPRLSRQSVTNEVPIEPKVVVRTPVIASTATPVPFHPIVPSQTVPMVPAGERTAITFGTTGRASIGRRVYKAQIAVAVTLAVLALGTIYVVGRGSSMKNIAQLIRGNQSALMARMAASTHIVPVAVTPPSTPAESIRRNEAPQPATSATPKAALTATPVITTTAPVKSVKAPLKQEKPVEAAPTHQPINRRNPVRLD